MESWRNELYHWGRSKRDGAKVGSGRYGLGTGLRPYQRYGGNIEARRLSGDAETRKAIARGKIENAKGRIDKIRKLRINDDQRKVINSIPRNAKNIVESVYKMKDANGDNKIDLSNLSNKELQDYITRTNLEKNYLSALSENNIDRGRTYVLETLSILNDAVGLATGTAFLYAMLKNKGIL